MNSWEQELARSEAEQEAAWLKLKRRVRSYLEFQGKDASYIDGFLEGYGRENGINSRRDSNLQPLPSGWQRSRLSSINRRVGYLV